MNMFKITGSCKSEDGVIVSSGFTMISADNATEAIQKYHRLKQGFNVVVDKIELVSVVN